MAREHGLTRSGDGIVLRTRWRMRSRREVSRRVDRAARTPSVEALEPRWLLSATAPRPCPGALAPGDAFLSSPQSGSNNGHHNKLIAGTPLGGQTTPAPFRDTLSAMEARDAASITPGGNEIDLGPEGADDDDAAGVLRSGRTDKRIYPGSVIGQPGTPQAPQSIGTHFNAISLLDQFNAFGTGSIPPDTMGAIGPNHFMEVINDSVAIFTPAGTRLSHVSLTSFFTVIAGGVNHPAGGAFDPRVLYDRRSGHWFASALEFGQNAEENGIILAVSRTSDPTGAWDKYFLDVSESASFTDYDTLGVDDNGVYLGMTIFPSSGGFEKIVAIPKASLLASSPSLGSVFAFSNIDDMFGSPQPAYNFDPVASTGRMWFVASSNTFFADVNYRTLTWSGGTPFLSSSSGVVSTPGFGSPVNFTPQGSTVPIDSGDQRLLMAIVRNNQLWTARTVGVNSGGNNSGSIDRDAAEWIELNVSSSTASLTQSGRVFDSSSSPRNYIYPSVMVNGQGHMAIGFSGGKSSEFMGAYATGRLASDPAGTTEAIVQLKAGQAAYTQTDGPNGTGRNRWGDYSYTSLDPDNDMSMWTIQEYVSSTNIWGTYVDDLLSPAPMLNNPSASGLEGQNNLVVNLTGSNFFDPGNGFADRLKVSFTGGTTNGITVTSVKYNSPTSVTVTLNIAAGATAGPRDIVLTNPDGQQSIIAGGLTVVFPTVYTGTSGSDDYLLRINPSVPGDVQILVGGTVSFSGPESSVTTLTFNTGQGDDHLTIDLANGNPIPSGGVFYDGGAGNDLLTINGSTSADSVTLANAFTGPLGGAININDPSNGAQTVESIIFNGNAGDDVLTVASAPIAPLTFNGGISPGSHDTLRITAAGTVTINGDVGAQTTSADVTVENAGGSVIFSASQHIDDLFSRGTVTLAQNGNQVIDTNTLTLLTTAGEGTLDLKDNDLIVRSGDLGTWNGSQYTGITGLLTQARAGGSWTGPGITSSLASTSGSFKTLGIASASQVFGIAATQTGTFDGETITGAAILVKYTYGGDANLDGRINIDDYGRIDSQVGLSGSAFGWYNGDFNYDGKINIDDYGIIDSGVGAQGPAL
jgi:hypothetical protein